MANRMANRMATAMANAVADAWQTAWQTDAPNPNPNPNILLAFRSSRSGTSNPNRHLRNARDRHGLGL